jgi:hypothetical protein
MRGLYLNRGACMRTLLVAVIAMCCLAGCGVADFAAKQNEWNRQTGMGGMNGPAMTGSDQTAAEKDAETQRNIKHGEDVENSEAAKAGLGPSPTDGMHCKSESSVTGSANNSTTTTNTSCHN